MEKEIRWMQRFENYSNAFVNLKQAVDLTQTRSLSKLEEQGVIQAFEFTFELGWKLIKDYLTYMEVDAKFPREAIKSGFQYDIIDDGEIWMDMLEKRNLMSHTYDEKKANLAFDLITKKYYNQLEKLQHFFAEKMNEK